MKRAWSYPHPVLGNQDDADGEFDLTPSVKVEIDGKVEINGVFLLKNEAIESLISAGQAEFVLRITCLKTYLRQSLVSSTAEVNLSLEKGTLRGEVKAEPMVVAKSAIKDYRPSGLNSQYGGATFSVSPGQILAIGPKYVFDLDIEFDPLRNVVASIIQIAKGAEHDCPFDVEFDDERIRVRISDKVWEKYQSVKNRIPYAIVAMIALPVVAEALHLMQRQRAEDDYGEFAWFQRLTRVLDERQLDVELEPLHLAQKLLQAPHQLALEQLDKELFVESEE